MNNAVIIGYGRMGKLYHDFLKSNNYHTFIVDKHLYREDASIFKSFDNLTSKINQPFDLIIDAAHSEGRLERLRKYTRYSEKIFLEKPLPYISSELVNEDFLKTTPNIKIAVNYPWQFSRFHQFISNIVKKQYLGKLKGIDFICGMVGFLNIGSHNLAIFKSILDEVPEVLFSSLSLQKGKNNRGNNVVDFDGVVSGVLKQTTFNHISNMDTGNGILEVYNFENGMITYERTSGICQVFKRPKNLFFMKNTYGRYYSIKTYSVKKLDVKFLLSEHLKSFLNDKKCFSYLSSLKISKQMNISIQKSNYIDKSALNSYITI